MEEGEGGRREGALQRRVRGREERWFQDKRGEGEGKERGEGVEAKRDKGAAAGAEKKLSKLKDVRRRLSAECVFMRGNGSSST